jgi:hypothetical protein
MFRNSCFETRLGRGGVTDALHSLYYRSKTWSRNTFLGFRESPAQSGTVGRGLLTAWVVIAVVLGEACHRAGLSAVRVVKIRQDH